jgi:hypothetical protein
MKSRSKSLRTRAESGCPERDCASLPASAAVLFGLNADERDRFAVLAARYARLAAYLGDTGFADLVRALTRTHPEMAGDELAGELPLFLQMAEPYRRFAELAEFAVLEQAIEGAFQAPCSSVVRMEELAALAPETFAYAVLAIQKPLTWLKFRTNVTSLWASMRCGVTPPKPERLAEPVDVIVWRQARAARFRILGAEEAAVLKQASQGVPFGALCEMMMEGGDAESAATRAAGYLRGWVEAELVCAVRIAAPAAEAK